MVFPSNFQPELDFAVMGSLKQLDEVVRRDFEAKAPTATGIARRAESGDYDTRYDLLRDVALNLFWVDRYAITMYEKRPVRWRDLPRTREDLFLPNLRPWDDREEKVAAVNAAYEGLEPRWDGTVEDGIHDLLFDVFSTRLYGGNSLSPIAPTVQEILARPENLTIAISDYEPDFPVFSYREILDCSEDEPALEALHRMAMVAHNQAPWGRDQARLEEVSAIDDDEFVVAFVPRDRDVLEFIHHVRSGRQQRTAPTPPVEATAPAKPFEPIIVSGNGRFAVVPRIEALAVAKGEHICANEDVIRNSAYSWSPMTADDISRKTGIEARRYTERDLEVLSLGAAAAALEGAGRGPEEIGAVIFCSCTSARLLPSVATWISGQLGIYQTHASFDLVAACAGFPYGLAEVVRVMQDVKRPVLLVMAEKFSDKIGSVRTSRMIFGDGAAAMVVAPAPEGETSDVEVLQTFASGPFSEVNSIIWPNPEFDNDITVWGPEVRSLVERYLVQMMGELQSLPDPGGGEGGMVDAIDIVVPHQANRNMVVELGERAGLSGDRMYFNIDKVGNVSAASIPIAISDAVAEGVIDRPMRVFAPGFGAGAVAGYAVLRLDPSIVQPEVDVAEMLGGAAVTHGASQDDVGAAFG